MVNDIVIIGGGASGLMCALTAGLKGKKVTILEAGFKVGKKIMASGNGRCNLTNKNISSLNYNNLPNIYSKFDNVKTLEFFNSLGLEYYFDEEDRCYPVSNHASAVLDVMENKLDTLGASIITNTQVTGIAKLDKGYIVSTTNGEYQAKKVVVATGGNSLQNVLTSLNIHFKPFKPSLCGLKTLQSTKLISGIRTECDIKVTANNFTTTESGEVIFKDDGISGICIFNLSAKLNWENIKNCSVSLNLLPNIKPNKLIEMLQQRKINLANLTVKQFFDGMLVKNLGLEILNRCHMNLSILVSKLSLSQLKNFATHLQNLTFNICGFSNNNQVHNGGVELSELTDNLECVNHAGLYFCGEIVNVDGECGGYNLQWAWTSGHIVGDSL